MTIKEYAEEVARFVKELIPNAQIKEMEITKNNGIVYHAISIKFEGTNIAPAIYIDAHFKEGIEPSEAAKMIKDMLESDVTTDAVHLEWITNFEKVKPKLRAKLVNKSNEAKVYRSAERYGFEDLIIVPYIMVDLEAVGGTITVDNKFLDMWGVSIAGVVDAALANCASEVREESLAEMLVRRSNGELTIEEVGLPMDYVLNVIGTTRGDDMWGAISIINKIDELKKELGNFYVIPSSVHEVIIAQATGNPGEKEYLEWMISDVNNSCVHPEERLSNTLYYFGE